MRVTRQQVGQGENVANEPNHQDGQDDLKEIMEMEINFLFSQV